MTWASRGKRQSSVDLWSQKPVMVNGTWKNARYRDEPKRFALPMHTMSSAAFAALTGKKINPGECFRI